MRDPVSLLLTEDGESRPIFPNSPKTEAMFLLTLATSESLCKYLCERRHSEGHLQGVIEENRATAGYQL